MSRTDSKGIQRVNGAMGSNFLAHYSAEDTSLASMASLVMVPRIKVIQSSTDPELKRKFGEGAVIVRPGDAVVWDPRTDDKMPFLFVPKFFHREWNKWADNNDKDRMIIEGPIFDENHPLAKKSQDKNTRNELYEGHEGKPDRDKMYYSYVEHLCWTGSIYGDHPLAGTEVVLSMERGEFYNGRQFINAISMRRETVERPDPNDPNKVIQERIKVPLWAQVWAMIPALREGDRGNWYGLDFQPADNPVIDQSDAEEFRARHAELARIFQEGRMRVVHGDDGKDTKPTDSPGDDD